MSLSQLGLSGGRGAKNQRVGPRSNGGRLKGGRGRGCPTGRASAYVSYRTARSSSAAWRQPTDQPTHQGARIHAGWISPSTYTLLRLISAFIAPLSVNYSLTSCNSLSINALLFYATLIVCSYGFNYSRSDRSGSLSSGGSISRVVASSASIPSQATGLPSCSLAAPTAICLSTSIPVMLSTSL